MPKWLVRTFTTDAGGKPVDEWIRSLELSARAEVALAIDLLKQHGTALTMPFVRHLGDGLWELRVRDASGIYRVVYFHWKGRTFGLLHGFSKKTRSTPKRDFELARTRRTRWLARASRKGRRPNG
ncbi:MAG: type II toxin-antitoxin system RelE/ParE family toxin [Dehalococcoidia bacterium]